MSYGQALLAGKEAKSRTALAEAGSLECCTSVAPE